ncbi:MAG TPA: aspartate carbamoyltransferase catalytic subunit [Acidimicrobiia bacterium]|nr:aspartate carbamoyltransferase catalytic subunit [Acidimicrobiia bacterium]
MKEFISIKSLGRADLETLAEDASQLRSALDEGQEIPADLKGSCLVNLFFEPSTRTRLSFDLAAQRLGAHVLTFFPETSSTTKGESLRDTVLTVAAIGADFLVVRHGKEGVPQKVADWTGLPVVNAGDGANEHPTQALLDAVTLYRRFGGLDGLRMAIVGDISHSRVAGSLISAMPAFGVDLTLVAPEAWLPAEPTAPTTSDLDDLLPDLDVVYLLRVQKERGGVIDDDFIERYGVDSRRASRLGPDAVIMHPGPINRGVELSEEVADSSRSLIVEQVRNGVPARMSVLRALDRGAR